MNNEETIRITIMGGILAIFFGIKQTILQETFEIINLEFSLKFISNIFFQFLLWMYIIYFLVIALNYSFKNGIKIKYEAFIFDFIITATIVLIFITLSLIAIIKAVIIFPDYVQAGWKTNLLLLISALLASIFTLKNLSPYSKSLTNFFRIFNVKVEKEQDYPNNMSNEKFRLSNIIEFILSLIIPAIAVTWLAGVLIEIAKMTNTGYLQFIEYAKISLTLFGFTLIGAVFEKHKLKKNPIIKKLFHYSIVFLSSSVGFFVLYSVSFIPFDKKTFLFDFLMPTIIFISMFAGYFGLIYGCLGLLRNLIKYSKEI